jgi:hypothetical protein
MVNPENQSVVPPVSTRKIVDVETNWPINQGIPVSKIGLDGGDWRDTLAA